MNIKRMECPHCHGTVFSYNTFYDDTELYVKLWCVQCHRFYARWEGKNIGNGWMSCRPGSAPKQSEKYSDVASDVGLVIEEETLEQLIERYNQEAKGCVCLLGEKKVGVHDEFYDWEGWCTEEAFREIAAKHIGLKTDG